MVPLAPLPLSGWNTVSCSLVFTPPGGWFSEGVGGCCPAGSSYGWGVYLAGETAFSLAGKRDVFILQLVFCLPGWGQNHFFFCLQKKKRFWTPKKKRETSGNLGVVRYNRIDYLC